MLGVLRVVHRGIGLDRGDLRIGLVGRQRRSPALVAEEGMLAANDHAFDIAIVDLILKGKGGLEVIGEMQKSLPDLKVIAISGGGEVLQKSYLPEAKALGATISLEKPFEAQILIDAVNGTVSN